VPAEMFGSRSARSTAFAVIGVLLTLGLVESAFRQRVWRDNETLFAQTVNDVPASYKAHMAYAEFLFQHNQRKKAFEEVELAHTLFPKDLDVLEYAAEEYSRVEGCRQAVGLFGHVLAEDPRRARSRVGLAQCLIAMGRHDVARKVIREGLATGESLSAFQRLTVINDSVETVSRSRGGK
jgi:tetratricopeptide (TPR) repeat protein